MTTASALPASSPFTHAVVALGNALVDIIVQVDDALLTKLGIVKGSMTLVDAARSAEIYTQLGSATEMSGGSAANTVAGIASMGGKAAFMGKVGDDAFGKVFTHDLKGIGVDFYTNPLTGIPTGTCLVLVTPDAQRTMCTHLGAAVEFGPVDVNEDIIKQSRITYLEGYLFDRPEAKAAFYKAAKIARTAGRHVALTLSDSFCVNRHRGEFLDLIRNNVDILIGNQHEIEALYETDNSEEALRLASKECSLVTMTKSAEGALVANKNEIIKVDGLRVASVVDTTGAGDLYAAGFLFGLSRDMPLAQCGTLGCRSAVSVLGHYGPRPQTSLRPLVA